MPPRSVFVLSLDSYGDLTLRQPLFRALLDAGLRVGVAVRRPHDGLLPFLDRRLEALATDLNPYALPDGAFWGRAAELRARIAAWTPDLLVCGLYNRTFLDQWLLRRSEAPTLGFANPALTDAELDAWIPETGRGLGPALGTAVPVQADAHEVDRNRALLEAIGLATPDPFEPAIRLPEEGEARARRTLEGLELEAGSYAFAAPAGIVNNPHKSWPPEAFLALAEHLERRHSLPLLLTGIALEAPLLEDLVRAGAERGLRLRQWLGGPEDLGELLGLIRLSRLYLGSDTGPMHFAAALDVPVLALFGGGHWPRFLPRARRSFVATRQLPCFGCGWDCWLPEAACVRSVEPRVLLDGLDWLLSGTEPERRTDLGTPLPEAVHDMVREGALRYRHTWSRTVAAERYYRMLEGYRDDLEKQRGELRARQAVLEGEGRVLRERLQASELEGARRLQTIRRHEAQLEHLEGQVAHLNTPRAALRVLNAAALRRLGLFDVASKGGRRLKRAVRAAKRRRGESPEPTPVAAPEARRSLPLLDAFVLARALPGDTGELALERLHRLGATLPDVLCVHPSPRNVQAAVMLAAGGARVAFLGTEAELGGASVPGLEATAQDLGAWWLGSGRSRLAPGTALLLDGQADEATLSLLNGRLSPDTPLLVNGERDEGWPARRLSPPAESVAGLGVHASPPEAWRDPSSADPEYDGRRPWLAPAQRLALPGRLPSGRAWPRISIVTVSLNQARFLEQTLLSVLRQDYPDLEYIVVDGGSSDGSREILERYRGQLAHCLIEPDEGQSHALNKGFALASGDLLAWLNSDDCYPPGALWRAALAFDAFQADLVAGGCRLVQGETDATLRVHHSSLPVGRLAPLPLDKLLDLDGSWLKGDFFFQPEVFWTRELWQRCGGQVAQELFFSMDYELWARMAHAGARAVHVPDVLAVYRVHEGQKTAGESLPYVPELRRVAAELRRRWGLP